MSPVKNYKMVDDSVIYLEIDDAMNGMGYRYRGGHRGRRARHAVKV